MSLSPQVPIKTKHAETFNTNIDRMMHTKGVTPEALEKHRARYSRDANKTYMSKTLGMMMFVTYNRIATMDQKYPSKYSVRDRIEFVMRLQMYESLIFARMTRGNDYYDDDEVIDRLTMEVCELKVNKLKKNRQWMEKDELNKYFKWHKKHVDTNTKTFDDTAQ